MIRFESIEKINKMKSIIKKKSLKYNNNISLNEADKYIQKGYISKLVQSSFNKNQKNAKYFREKEDFKKITSETEQFLNDVKRSKISDREVSDQINKNSPQTKHTDLINFSYDQNSYKSNRDTKPLNQISERYKLVTNELLTPKNDSNSIKNSQFVGNDNSTNFIDLYTPKSFSKSIKSSNNNSNDQLFKSNSNSSYDIINFEMNQSPISLNGTQVNKKLKFDQQNSILDECDLLLKEEETSMNPKLLQQRDQYHFFENNISKVINLEHQVDLSQSSSLKKAQDEFIKESSGNNLSTNSIKRHKSSLNNSIDMIHDDIKSMYRKSELRRATTKNFSSSNKKATEQDDQIQQAITLKAQNRVDIGSKLVQPDISHEKKNIQKWWDYEMQDQQKKQENRQEFIMEATEYADKQRKGIVNNNNQATYKRYIKYHQNNKIKK